MKSTIEDVAREAGVSIATVSRAINNNYPVKQETRIKIQTAIEKLNFTPNSLARSLIHKKTYTIGVVLPSITNLFFTAVVKGIENLMKQNNYSLLLLDDDGDPDNEVIAVKSLLEKRVDGIICIDPRTKNIKSGFYENLAAETPLVLINGYHKGVQCNFVMNDQEYGTIEALKYLLGLGHTKIALFRGYHSYSNDLKEDIYREILHNNGISVNENHIITIENSNNISGVNSALEHAVNLLKSDSPPTAIFACNDWLAVGALNGALRLNIAVPDELSVIGYDNVIISEISYPKLTTVDQNMHALGNAAAGMLLECIEGSKDIKKIILNTKLVLRNSCGNRL